MKIPMYTKSPISPVDFRRNSDLSEPAPFVPITIQENHTVRPPSDSSDGFTAAGYFSIPFDNDGSLLTAVCRVKLEVDDWGFPFNSLKVKSALHFRKIKNYAI